MNYAEMILPEFDREMANTRKVLERLPEDRLDWQAHAKSHTIGWNANHLAEILGWVEGILVEDEAPNHHPSRHGEERRSSLEQRPRLRQLVVFHCRNCLPGDGNIPPDPPPCDFVCLSPSERHLCPRDV
jgi:hypothetical protein